jgi:hypothetical protein
VLVFAIGKPFQLGVMFVSKARAYPSGALVIEALGPKKHLTRLEIPERDKPSSLF